MAWAFVAKDKTEDILKYLTKQEEVQSRAYILAQDRYKDGMTSQLDRKH